MRFFQSSITLFSLFLLGLASVWAKSSEDYYYRDFWKPKYHAEYLSYCSCDGSKCGKTVANQYCQQMGYQKASRAIKYPNVGIANYINEKGQCKGWECNGFQVIRCQGKLDTTPPKPYHYRYKQFNYPRMSNYRVAWCYRTGTDCGREAAQSFCRRLGYLKASSFTMDKSVKATKSLGDHALCFGDDCAGFDKIVCFR